MAVRCVELSFGVYALRKHDGGGIHMRRFMVAAILSALSLSSSAMEISVVLTKSILTLDSGVTIDTTAGLSAEQWTDLASWRWSLKVYDGSRSAQFDNFMFGTLPPLTSITWDLAYDVSWTGAFGSDGWPSEIGFWFVGTNGLPLSGLGGDEQQMTVVGNGHAGRAYSVSVTNGSAPL